MERRRFLFIVSGLFVIVVLSLGIAFFLVPDSVPRGVFGHVTVSGECDLVGDNEPCGAVTLSEVVSLINQWVGGGASLRDVVFLINAWVSSPTTTTVSSSTSIPSTTTTLAGVPRLSITLSTPSNNTNTTQRNLSFNYTVIGSNSTYNCSLFLNRTLYNTSLRTVNNTLSRLNVTNLGYGTWWWNITCNINSSISNTSQTRIIIIRATTTTSTTTTSSSTTTTLPSNSSHPYLLFHNITETPGYQHSSTSPWNSWEYDIISTADSYLSLDFTGDMGEGYDRMGYRSDFAQKLALAYQVTKDTAYAAKAKEALMNLEKGYIVVPGYEKCWALGGYSMAYDWVQPYLDSGSDITIRDKLATLADDAYMELNYNGTQLYYVSFADHHGRGYPLFGLAAATLNDYTNPNHLPLHSNQSDWLKVATDYLFVNDELHSFNRSVLSFGFDEATGKFISGSYKDYVIGNFALWYQVYNHYYGQNLMDRYPAAKKITTSEIWESLPNLYHNNCVTSGNAKELYPELFINLLDSENKSNALNYLDLIKSYNILPYSTEMGGLNSMLGYCTYQEYSSVPRSFPDYTSYLNRDGMYQVFRSDWETDANWMSLVTFNIEYTNSNRDEAHHDQLSFEYYSRGDLLMADGGEVKSGLDRIYGEYETFHNTVAIENPRTPFSLLSDTNSVARCIYKGDASGLQTPVAFNNMIQTPWLEVLDMGANITKVVDAGIDNPASLSSPIKYQRAVLFPEKEYFIVVDRLEGSESWIYRNSFRFTSLNIIPSGESTTGNVIGNLSINGTPYSWLSLAYKTETATGLTANSIRWNTTNPYNDKVYLQLYSVPSSEIKAMKYETRIGGYDGRAEVYAPIIYFRTSAQNNLYRATVLLPRYSAEEEKIPSQITVTGTGNALKVSSSSYTDYVYTGKGTSSFGNFSTDADTLYFRDASDKEYTLLNGTYVNYSGSVLSLSQRVGYFTLKEDSGDLVFKIKTTGSTDVTIYGTGTITSVTMDGATHSSWHMSGSDVVITSPTGEHYFELT